MIFELILTMFDWVTYYLFEMLPSFAIRLPNVGSIVNFTSFLVNWTQVLSVVNVFLTYLGSLAMYRFVRWFIGLIRG